ncbi:MAG: DNA polymerase Y family protein [Actinomycetaceae bacterium]|nr:DNA polymerase Y family protein [Actinomycetaceae bacterium]
MKRVVLVWFADWETNALVIDCPPGTPAVTVERGRVRAATRRAYTQGVRPGMRIALARHLCKGLVVVDHDEKRSARSFYAVLDALDEVSAHVCAIAPGIAWLPASAARWAGGEEKLCEQVIDAVAFNTGAECSVGIGPGLLGGWVGALRGEILTDMSPVRELPLAATLPLLNDSDESERVIQTLATLGIETVGDLLDYGPTYIASRFGEVGMALHRLLTRDIPLEVDARVVDEGVSETLTFDTPIVDGDIVVGYFLKAATRLINRLVARQITASIIQISAVMNTPDGQRCRERLWSLTDFPTPRDLTDRLRWQTRGWIDEINRTVPRDDQVPSQDTYGMVSVTLCVVESQPIDSVAARLWGHRSEEDMRATQVAFRLQALLGIDYVQQARIVDGFDPLSRTVFNTWGTSPHTLPWEQWRLPVHWHDDARYGREHRWEGKLGGESPATVFDRHIPVVMRDEDGRNVRVTAEGTVSGTITTIVVQEENEVLHSVGIGAGSVLTTVDVRGPWPVLGHWWDTASNARGARAWINAEVEVSKPVSLLVMWSKQSWRLVAMWH